MPQMAPMNWLLMLTLILTLMYLMNSMIYFSSTTKLMKNKKLSIKLINWKW
uniref:ATP synthase subunit 8 n=1 Tax=Agonita chinensis TaxID=2003340 RepID=A0A343SEM7_9CUCU|nr:ATP synthase subunit 8 [Agonita chinensis]